jgi:sulfide:quinone oxidoreductase
MSSADAGCAWTELRSGPARYGFSAAATALPADVVTRARELDCVMNAGAGAKSTRVLISGGGVAAAELLLALRDLAGDAVAIELLAPNHELVYRPLAVVEPFGIGEALRFDLDAIAADHGARRHAGALASVDTERHVVTTTAGDELRYDLLVIATGARPSEAIPGALTLTGDGFASYRTLLEGLRDGDRLVFAAPTGVVWDLPLYELALMTSTWASAHDVGVAIALVTPEEMPLAVFGQRVAAAVKELLESRGIELACSRRAVSFDGTALVVMPGPDLAADRVVALPALEGPAIAGLPHDETGFLPTDKFGAVLGAADVYAAGDATAFPVKQGGLAVQQADVVAEAIAARTGAAIEPEPFDPVLRGVLLTGTIPRYLHASLGEQTAEAPSGAEVEPEWWPPTKIAGGYLSRYLARLAAAVPPAPDAMWLRLETDDLESYLGARRDD